jgi:hypothetical protein
MLSSNIPVMADGDKYSAIGEPFSLNDLTGNKIPLGSTIHYFENGETEVTGPDNTRLLLSNDSLTGKMPTPNGEAKYSRIIFLPDCSEIVEGGSLTKIYKDDKLILTVIDDKFTMNSNSSKFPPPAGSSTWIEYAYSTGLNIDTFNSYWYVPTSPTSTTTTAVDYIFNAFQNSTSTQIVQPVLEWNVLGNHTWTGAAWYGAYGTYYRVGQVSASPGQTIYGQLLYSGSWFITLKNNTTGYSAMGLATTVTFTPTSWPGNTACLTLEGRNGLQYNNEVCGDINFFSSTLYYQNVLRSISWSTKINSSSFPSLTGLGLSVNGGYVTTANLYTAN